MGCLSYASMRDSFKNFLNCREAWENIAVTVKPLSVVQAIGQPEHSDYPLLRGKEVLLESTFLDGRGQAFTNRPTTYKGVLREVLEFNLEDNSRRAVFFATLNAVLNHFGSARGTVHCRDSEPGRCGPEIAQTVKEKHGAVPVGIVGYQPGIIAGCITVFGKSLVRVTDMNTDNLGMNRLGVEIWDGVSRTDDLTRQSEVLLVTGTTLINGTAFDLLNKAAGKPFYFYGSTAAGSAELAGYERLCPYSKN